jgi:DNA polymerase I-like protein with 3'-5' exonuclease and polymerase domains
MKRIIGIDIETDDPHLTTKGPSWVWDTGKILCVGLHDGEEILAIDGAGGVRVKQLLLSNDVILVGANLAYDIGWLLYAHGLKAEELRCELVDVAVAESLIDEYQKYSLDELSLKYLAERKGYGKLPFYCKNLNLRGDFRKHLGTLWDSSKFRGLYRDEIREYVISDADQPVRIWTEQQAILEREELMSAFTVQMEMLHVLIRTKQHGVRIDHTKWLENCEKAEAIRVRLQTAFDSNYGNVNSRSPIQLTAFMTKHGVPFDMRITIRGFENKDGSKFNVKHNSFSQIQMQRVLAELKKDFFGVRMEKGKLKLYVPQVHTERVLQQLRMLGYNAIANPNFSKLYLQSISGQYPVIRDMLQLRTVDGIIKKFLGQDFAKYFALSTITGECRIHPDIGVVGARQTSRMSSRNPNCQNIPSRTVLFQGTEEAVDLAAMCREVFIPEKGHVWCKLDFKGQELLMQAHFAVGEHGDQIRAKYNEDPYFDEHQFVGEISGLNDEYGTELGRKYAKNLRFMLAYGGQLNAVCATFGWEREQAKNIMDAVVNSSVWFTETKDAVAEVLRQRGYVKTLLGRRIHLKDFGRMSRQELVSAKVYPFYNYVNQGSGADQTKMAQVGASKATNIPLLLSVHDEGNYSIPMNESGLRLLKLLHGAYTAPCGLDVPTICEPEIGHNWSSCVKIKRGETLDQFWERAIKEISAGGVLAAETEDIVDFGLLGIDEDEDEDMEYEYEA